MKIILNHWYESYVFSKQRLISLITCRLIALLLLTFITMVLTMEGRESSGNQRKSRAFKKFVFLWKQKYSNWKRIKIPFHLMLCFFLASTCARIVKFLSGNYNSGFHSILFYAAVLYGRRIYFSHNFEEK